MTSPAVVEADAISIGRQVEELRKDIEFHRSRADALERRCKELESIIGPVRVLPRRWRLTGTEDTVLRLLLSRDVVAKDELMGALYGDRNAPPERKTLDVFVCKIRKKVEPLGIEIVTVWGRGWTIDEATRDRIKAEIAA